jgi:hypothetical protein
MMRGTSKVVRTTSFPKGKSQNFLPRKSETFEDAHAKLGTIDGTGNDKCHVEIDSNQQSARG